MPTTIVLRVNDRYPAGTSVGAYVLAAGATAPSGVAPSGSPAATAVVAADGTLTFPGLLDNQRYFAYALIGSEHRYVLFSTQGGSAYTQTFSTASRTVSAATSAAVATTAATTTTPAGYTTTAQADAIVAAINAIRADQAVLRELVNALIDDLQAAKIVQ